MPKRNIVVIIGSKNDLKQCRTGFIYLQSMQSQEVIEVVAVHVKSIHRHTEKLLKLLRAYDTMGDIDVIIAGAGKAAHLPGCIDAYLRNHLLDTKTVVIGVGFLNEDEQDNLASALSITQVPGTQVLYAGQGGDGFLNACITACERSLPEIKAKEVPKDLDLTLQQAYEISVQES